MESEEPWSALIMQLGWCCIGFQWRATARFHNNNLMISPMSFLLPALVPRSPPFPFQILSSENFSSSDTLTSYASGGYHNKSNLVNYRPCKSTWILHLQHSITHHTPYTNESSILFIVLLYTINSQNQFTCCPSNRLEPSSKVSHYKCRKIDNIWETVRDYL